MGHKCCSFQCILLHALEEDPFQFEPGISFFHFIIIINHIVCDYCGHTGFWNGTGVDVPFKIELKLTNFVVDVISVFQFCILLYTSCNYVKLTSAIIIFLLNSLNSNSVLPHFNVICELESRQKKQSYCLNNKMCAMEMDKKCAKILHHLHNPSVLLGTMERK